jgi:hypothetical protein
MFDFLIYNAKELFWKILSFTDFKTITNLCLCSKYIRNLILTNRDDCCLQLNNNESIISDFWKDYCLIVTHLKLKGFDSLSQLNLFRFFNPSYKRYLKKLTLIETKINPNLIKLRTDKDITVFETNLIPNLRLFLPKTVILVPPIMEQLSSVNNQYKFDKLIFDGFNDDQLNELNDYKLEAKKYVFKNCILESEFGKTDIKSLELNNCLIETSLNLNADKIIVKNMKDVSNIIFNSKFLLLKYVDNFNCYNINTRILHINSSYCSSTLIKRLSDYFNNNYNNNKFKKLKIGILFGNCDVCHFINSLFLVEKNLKKVELVLNESIIIDKKLIKTYIKNLFSINNTIEVNMN